MKVFNDNELIKKWDAIVALLSIDEYNPKSIQAIRKLPIIESEREKGKWILHIDNSFPVESTIECNQCHERQPVMATSHFCPNCGADMRGEQE